MNFVGNDRENKPWKSFLIFTYVHMAGSVNFCHFAMYYICLFNFTNICFLHFYGFLWSESYK